MNVKQILQYGMGAKVIVVGKLIRFKVQKKFMFGAICDGSESTGLQFIHTFTDEGEGEDSIMEFVTNAAVGASIIISGEVIDSPSKGQTVELKLETCKVVCDIREPEHYLYGSAMCKRMGPVLMDERLINIRSDTFERFNDKTLQAIFRIRSALKLSLYKFFADENGFVQVDTPILSKSDCEGAGETYQVTTMDLKNVPLKDGNVDYSTDFFGVKANLTVSGQLEAEALCKSLPKVFTFGPTFRAENSNTSRHLSEFWMIEPEFVCVDPDLEKRFHILMDLQEDMLQFVIKSIMSTNLDDLTYLEKVIEPGLIERLGKIGGDRFARVTYTEVIELLKIATVEFEIKEIVWGMDLNSDHERYICEQVFKKPTFITHCPRDLKSFYMKMDEGCNPDQITCQACDLLVPNIGELCGGSCREDDPEKLIANMVKKGMNVSDLQWYVDLRYDGYLPSQGMGMGFERLIRYVTGIKSIRDVIAFPRYQNHI